MDKTMTLPRPLSPKLALVASKPPPFIAAETTAARIGSSTDLSRNYSKKSKRLVPHPDDWLNEQIVRMGGAGLRRCQIAEIFDTSEGRIDNILRRMGAAKSRDLLSAMAACPEFRDAVYLYTGGTLALSPAVSAAVENLSRALLAEKIAADADALLKKE